MIRRILLSGGSADFKVLHFDPESRDLSISAHYPAPDNVSWAERSSSQGSLDRFVGVSEADDRGDILTFEIDHEAKACRVTSKQPTLGAPCHFETLPDESALALATYYGGSISFYRISITHNEGLLLQDAPPSEFFPPFPYSPSKLGPNPVRQEQVHIHQILQDKQGLLYALDLGSDRVWILRRNKLNVEICGWLQCPPGTGPRHAVMTPDERMIYVLGELSHNVLAFDISNTPEERILPIDGFQPHVIPPDVPLDHQFRMDAAELCFNPVTPDILYASNRWARHIARRQPELKDVSEEVPPGDAIAIILLSADGKKVEEIKYVRTGADTIRGMRVSDDGKYVAVVGQEGGGVEIYEISGRRGDEWTLVAFLREGLGGGLKHALWL